MTLRILSKIKKYFLKETLEKYDNCILCGKQLTGNQRKFCSDKCNNSYWRKTNSNKIKLKYLKGGYKNAKKY